MPKPIFKRSSRSSWEADRTVVSSEDFSIRDIETIEGDPWVDELREMIGLPTSTKVEKRVENPDRPFSTIEKPVDTVWRICSEMKGSSRADMIAACVAAGVNVHTARTQQSKWAVNRIGGNR